MTWIISVVGVILLSVLTDVLLPEGQMNKYVKGIFSILLVFVIIAPIADFLNKDVKIEDILNFEFKEEEYVAESDSITILENEIKAELKILGIECDKVVIFSKENNIDTLTDVRVFLRQEADEDIRKTVTNVVIGKLGADRGKITVYGI